MIVGVTLWKDKTKLYIYVILWKNLTKDDSWCYTVERYKERWQSVILWRDVTKMCNKTVTLQLRFS